MSRRDRDASAVQLLRQWMGKGGGGGWWFEMPPLNNVVQSFFLDDKNSAPDVFSNCWFIPRADF